MLFRLLIYQLTRRTNRTSSGFDRGSIPRLDSVQHTLLNLALSGESRYFFSEND